MNGDKAEVAFISIMIWPIKSVGSGIRWQSAALQQHCRFPSPLADHATEMVLSEALLQEIRTCQFDCRSKLCESVGHEDLLNEQHENQGTD